MTKLVNCTPHDLKIINGDDVIVIPTSGTVARVSVDQQDDTKINNIPVVTQVYGDIVGLPAPAPDTYYIVSSLVHQAAKANGRRDTLSPNTSKAIRDDFGQIIGVPGFVR